MKIVNLKSPNDLVNTPETVLVLGYFDGLHLGHRALFEKAQVIAKELSLPISVLTFPETPKLAFAPFTPELLLHLLSPEKRFAKFESFGVETLYLIEFTSQFSQTSADDFITTYIDALQAKAIVVGFDYHFGKGRAGVDYLSEKFSGQVVTVDEVQWKGEKISSSRIRNLLAEGDVRSANALLGESFSTRGIVVHGDARGRTIGYPTANLAPLDRTHLPADGVYVTEVLIEGQRYRAMTSIGKNITFGGKETRLESHIFDFSQDIYGQTIDIIWLDKLRDMVKFDSSIALIDQLNQDSIQAKDWSEK